MASSSIHSGKNYIQFEVGKAEDILNQLKDENVKRVVLVGESGVGKTWIAREVIYRGVSHLFDLSIWVDLNRKYDQISLCKIITRQLTFLSPGPGNIHDDYDDDVDQVEDENNNLENMKEVIFRELEIKKFLLILDGETEDDMENDLTSLLPLNQQKSNKVLIIRGNNNNLSVSDDTKIIVVNSSLTKEQSKFLLKKKVGVYTRPEIEQLAEAFLRRSNILPIEVITFAKALRCLSEKKYGLEVLYSSLSEDTDNFNATLLKVLCSEYKLFPLDILYDFTRLESCFFDEHGIIHYRELITYWMLEGFLGYVDSMENTFQRGCDMLLELVDCGILKMIEANHLVINTPYCRSLGKQYVDNAKSILGMSTVSGHKWKGLGRIMLIDGSEDLPNSISTLVINGNRFEMDFLDKFLESVPNIDALALFNPCFTSFPKSLTTMRELKLLVLRGCDFLKEILHFLDIKYLTILEISGPNSLNVIPDDFFGHVRFLQSLTLSSLKISKLPSSLFYLTELVRVVVQKCSSLEILPSFRNARKLKVLDFSGCTSLMRCTDRSFNSNKELQILDLSRTLIKSVPLLSKLEKLTSLLLRDCRSIDKLPTISQSTKLQVLDISGSGIKELHEFSSGASDLQIINCSHSSISILPRNIGNAHYLYLRGCSRLENLRAFEPLTHLKELDLSYSTQLTEIDSNFFTHLTTLRLLNLSETNLVTLPSLSTLVNLRKLLLSNCYALKNVGDINSLTKLEVLDLSGCSALSDIDKISFTQMRSLQSLLLSHTNITSLSSLSNCTNLSHLIHENCTELKVLPSKEKNQSQLLDQQTSSSMYFHFVIHPVEAQNNCMEMMINKQDLLLRDINFQRCQISHSQEQKPPSLVIFGHYVFPRSVEPVLCGAEFLFLIKNSFMRRLHDLGAENIKEIKVCWIERCNYMKDVFLEDDAEDATKPVEDIKGKGKGKLDEVETFAKTGYDLQVLWISNNSNLELVFRGNVQGNNFEMLKFLHLEYCPQLSSLCSSSFFLENLEVLRIKFCDNFVSLCDTGLPTLPKLLILQLWELPKLNHIDCIAPNLHTLLVGNCHVLPKVFSSTSCFSENLEVLEIKFCDNLKTVFEDGGESTLKNLHKLHLWDLPNFSTFGARLPPLEDYVVKMF